MTEVAVVGFGNRAQKYVSCLDEQCRVAAVVETDPDRCRQVCSEFRITPEKCFSSVDELFESGIQVDAVIITTPDRTHYRIACECMDRGWPALLEKPIATTVEECADLVRRSKETGSHVSVCYELHRYPLYMKLKEIVRDSDSGLGKLLSVHHLVDVGIKRFTHSYVRGKWAREAESGPITLTKLCHDIDLFIWILGEAPLSWESSGCLSTFCRENAPEGISDRCIACTIEKSCPYSAVDLYRRKHEWTKNFVCRPGETDAEMIDRLLSTSDYGRCVYACDNDVNDTQKVLMHFSDDIDVLVEMKCETEDGLRKTTMQFENGTVEADAENVRVCVSGKDPQEFQFPGLESEPLHAGADKALTEDFIRAVRAGEGFPSSLDYALSSHLVCLIPNR